MAAKHNKDRYGELWPLETIKAIEAEIEALKDYVVISGGWAWHYMSPPHIDYKHSHDHRDADLFVIPERSWELFAKLAERGFEKTATRFDGVTPNFVRYVKYEPKVILDLFTEHVPTVILDSGIQVVEPNYLLSLYGVKHSSDTCFSVKIARELIAKGESPINNPKMVDFKKLMV